jgi:isoquinoline 1-oxidoreductase subunit beta
LTPVGTYKNPLPEQTVVGLHKLGYHIPRRYFEARRIDNHIPVGYRRAVGFGVNKFYLESFIDELAHAAGKDCYEYRRELVARNSEFPYRDDWLLALDTVAKMSGLGTPLPEDWARGNAIEDGGHPTRKGIALCAEVVSVSISKGGQLRLERVDVAFDEGYGFVNLLSVRKQIEGQIAWAVSDVMWQELTVKDGRIVEGNFDEYQVAPWPTIRHRSTYSSSRPTINGSPAAPRKRLRRSRPQWPRQCSRSAAGAFDRSRSAIRICVGRSPGLC